MPTSELLRYSCKMCQTCIRRLSSKNWKPSDEILVRICPSVDLWNKSSITIIRTYYHNWGNKALVLLLRHHYTLKNYKHCLVRNLNHSLTQHAVRVCVHYGICIILTWRCFCCCYWACMWLDCSLHCDQSRSLHQLLHPSTDHLWWRVDQVMQ